MRVLWLVWASPYTSAVFQAPSFLACLGAWPSLSEWDHFFLLLLLFFFLFFSTTLDFFWFSFFLTCHSVLSYFIYIHYLSVATATLSWWRGLWGSVNLRAMLAGDLFLLVGPPMPERSMVRDQTKSSLPALRVMRLGWGLITHSSKKFMITETAAALHTPCEVLQGQGWWWLELTALQSVQT